MLCALSITKRVVTNYGEGGGYKTGGGGGHVKFYLMKSGVVGGGGGAEKGSAMLKRGHKSSEIVFTR